MKLLKLLFCCWAFNNLLILPVMASSDINYCDFSLAISAKPTNSCSNLPFLSPYNDSRTNLILLIDDIDTQQATLASLASPQNKAPYLANDIRKNIAMVPFELTIYDAYLDNISRAKQVKLTRIKARLNNKTILLIKQILGNTSILEDDDFLTSPALEFINQIATAYGLNDQERKDLLLARFILFDNPKADISSFIPSDPSFTARHFINYLQGATAFYKNDYPTALKFFNEANTAAQSWVKEAATYMIARTLLNQGQAVAYNNWYELDLKKVDQALIKRSRLAFANYLRRYPRGKYVNSAVALLRRLDWLSGRQVALASSYESLLNNPSIYTRQIGVYSPSVADLILEIDNKIYFNSQPATANTLAKTPKLLAVYDLLKMRDKQLTLADLEKQQSTFEHNTELYNYLLAAYYTYVEANPEQVLILIPELVLEDETATINSLQFSGLMLRAMALENSYRWAAAENLWLTLNEFTKRPYQLSLIELGLALNYEKTARVTNAFAKQSIINTPQLRYILLRKNTDHKQLIQLLSYDHLDPSEKASIIYLLLYKDLLSQNYDRFLNDSALLIADNSLDETELANITKYGQSNLTLFSEAVPSHPDYPCPSPVILANVLKLNPTDVKALNCLGEFSEHYQLPFTHYMLNSATNSTDSLGTNRPTEFGEYLYSRLKGYQFVIASNNADDEDKAYALYKAIRCFSSGYNHCDSQDIPRAQRKQWFNLLHTKYATTLWAKQQTIYW